MCQTLDVLPRQQRRQQQQQQEEQQLTWFVASFAVGDVSIVVLMYPSVSFLPERSDHGPRTEPVAVVAAAVVLLVAIRLFVDDDDFQFLESFCEPNQRPDSSLRPLYARMPRKQMTRQNGYDDTSQA